MGWFKSSYDITFSINDEFGEVPSNGRISLLIYQKIDDGGMASSIFLSFVAILCVLVKTNFNNFIFFD
jgi:hypothetical protein